MRRLARWFGISTADLRASLRANVVLRRAILTYMDGLATFGAREPQPPGAPLMVICSVTQRCNLRCAFCYNEAYRKGDEPRETPADEVRWIF